MPISPLCPICSEADETILHALLSCSFATSVWNRSRISMAGNTWDSLSAWWRQMILWYDNTILEEVASIAWGIWQARNKVVWKSKGSSAAAVVFSARQFIGLYQNAQKCKQGSLCFPSELNAVIEHWTPPVQNQIKVNVDGAIFASEGRYGFGCVARDSNGQVLSAFHKDFVGCVQPEIAEVIGIKEA